MLADGHRAGSPERLALTTLGAARRAVLETWSLEAVQAYRKSSKPGAHRLAPLELDTLELRPGTSALVFAQLGQQFRAMRAVGKVRSAQPEGTPRPACN